MKSGKWLFLLFIAGITMVSCGKNTIPTEYEGEQKSLVGYVVLQDPVDQVMVLEGRKIFNVQCTKCHTLDTARFFVPSFAGITNRRTPESIMNMVINVNTMVEVDSIAHGLWKETGIRMPEPGLKVDQARSILEFLRENDQEQLGSKDKGVALRK